MNRVKLWFARTFFGDFIEGPVSDNDLNYIADKGSRDSVKGIVSRIGLISGDGSSDEFEPPEFDLTQIYNGYNTDSYIRQGVDKYIDQIFKEGWTLHGKDESVVEYLELRLDYMAEATGVPTGQLLTDIAEDVVKYANSIIVKARAKDTNAIPDGVNVTGLDGAQPVAGYFCLNVPSMKVKRDKNGMVKGWEQEIEGNDDTQTFKDEDIVHIYYKREKGNAFGTSFLIPVLDDVRALRQAEENVLRMMYRHIYPFYHVAVGTDEFPGKPNEVIELQESINSMDIDGGMVTTNRVAIKPVASDEVINAEPYLKHLEQRVFTGLGVPAIMFGRGETANRSTGDNMTSEMADRIKAIQRTIEMFFNDFILKELLLEGGYDPVLSPEHVVQFKFRENDLDTKIKSENHAIYKYEHNAIDEDEMRDELGMDPITDRGKMHHMLIRKDSPAKEGEEEGSKEGNNKQKPENQHGKKTSPKKTTNSSDKVLINNVLEDFRDLVTSYIGYCEDEDIEPNIREVESLIDSSLCDLMRWIENQNNTSNTSSKSKVELLFKNISKDIESSIEDSQDLSELSLSTSTIIDLSKERVLSLYD